MRHAPSVYIAGRLTLYNFETGVYEAGCCSLVQGVAAGFIALHHTQHLDVLGEEAGRQQAVDPQLEALLQAEAHTLQAREGGGGGGCW